MELGDLWRTWNRIECDGNTDITHVSFSIDWPSVLLAGTERRESHAGVDSGRCGVSRGHALDLHTSIRCRKPVSLLSVLGDHGKHRTYHLLLGMESPTHGMESTRW